MTRQLLFSLVFATALSATAGEEIAWKRVRNEVFSFSLPSSFTKTDAHGIDSFVEEYVGAGAKLTFDYGWYSNNFGDWPKDTKFEELMIHGRAVRIGVAKREFHEGYPWSAQVHIKIDDRFSLSMFVACKSEKEVVLARRIFLTIIFNATKSA